MKLSIVIPAYNEEENIADIVNKIEGSVQIEHELVAVNDHSADKTKEILLGLAKKYHNLVVIDNDLKQGFANALKSGFKSASGEVVVPVMGDLCDDLTTIPFMFEKIKEGYDVVCGARYIKGGARLGGSKLKAFLSSFGGRSLNRLLGVPTHDIANAFKMYKKKVLDSVNIEAKGFEISMELPLKAYYAGFKITEVPTTWKERTKGKSSFKVFKLLPSYLKLYLWAASKKIKGGR